MEWSLSPGFELSESTLRVTHLELWALAYTWISQSYIKPTLILCLKLICGDTLIGLHIIENQETQWDQEEILFRLVSLTVIFRHA